MKPTVVFVKPPEISRFNFGTFSLGVLAAAIRHMAHISILDATDLSIDKAIDAIWSLHPDIIGVTVMGLTSVTPAKELFQRLRTSRANAGALQHVTLLAGGHGASMTPVQMLEAGADAVVIGEGEITLQQILDNGIRPGAPGLACRIGGQVINGPLQSLVQPLDCLFSPARDLMPPPPDGVYLMETSRGCPHACAFCETTRFYGQRWRPHTPEWVAAEVKRLVEDYGAWIIHFADDNFAASPKRVLQICDLLQRGPLPAFIMISARGDDLIANPYIIPALAAAHILRVTVGVETVEPGMASKVGKSISREVYRDVFEHMREHGIFSVASLIVGLPGESSEMRKRAVESTVDMRPDSAHFLPFLPLPGTPLAQGHYGFDADPVDIHDACQFTESFFQHQSTKRNLAVAADSTGIRGMLARAALARFTAPDPITNLLSL
jgi:radical SAM superfamily enzyme YgiQ (UPF0313 family)